MMSDAPFTSCVWSNLHERTLRVTLNRCKWRQRNWAQRRWRSCVRGIVYEWARGIVCDCVRGIVYECPRANVYERVRGVVYEWTRGAVYECQRRYDRVRLIYDVGALAPKIVTRCGASPSVLLSRLHVVCVVKTPRVLKQGVCKLHCWFTEPDANLLLTCELFLLPSRKLVDLTRLHLGAVRSLWWFSWLCLKKNLVVL